MAKEFKIGVIIADIDEYKPIEEYSDSRGGIEKNLKVFKGHIIPFGDEILRTVLCGNGKVNAAVATTLLIEEGVDIIVNFGLSGGISGVKRGDVVIGSKFLEHDFDLTTLGYSIGEKPLQKYVFESDKGLQDLFKATYSNLKCGTLVTGDSFVSSAEKRDMLSNAFGALACDMESAAIAFCCDINNVPFISLRKISDDAGASAIDDYREMNVLADKGLMEIVFDTLKALNKAEFGA